MIEQYIYTRLDGGGAKKDYGHGLAFTTSGIVNEIENDISTISRYSNTTVDGNGQRVKIIEKRNLGTSQYVSFQQSVRFAERSSAGNLSDDDEALLYYSSTNRPQFLSHGFVCDVNDSQLLNPDKWFSFKYIDYNVNLQRPTLNEMDTFPDGCTPLEPLRTVLKKTGLTLDSFIAAVRASFDTENRDTIELIELDFTRTDAQFVGEQLIRWIYHFLPYSMRRQADFSTCYDNSCGGHDFAIALIPSAMLVRERGGRITFKGMPSSAKFGYIFSADGQCSHQKLRERQDFNDSESIYARWLEQVIRLTYEQEHNEAQDTLATLDAIYSSFDEYIKCQPDKKQCKTENYDAMCWAYLSHAIDLERHIEAADRAVQDTLGDRKTYIKYLFELDNKKPIVDLIPLFLDDACFGILNQGYDFEWLTLVTKIRDEMLDSEEVKEVLNICFAAIFKCEKDSILSLINEFYRIVLPKSHSLQDEAAFLETAFSCAEPKNDNRWKMVFPRSTQNGEKRFKTWIGLRIVEKKDFAEYLKQTKAVYITLSSFSTENLSRILDLDCIPLFNIKKCSFADLGALMSCTNELNKCYVENALLFERICGLTFDNIRDAMMESCHSNIEILQKKPALIVDMLSEIREAFSESEVVEDAIEFETECLNIWLSVARLQRKGMDKKFTFLPDQEDIHSRMVSELFFAYEHDIDTFIISDAYDCTLSFLFHHTYSHRTPKWYSEAVDCIKRMRAIPNVSTITTEMWEVLCRFVAQDRHDYGTFAQVVEAHSHANDEWSLVMLKCIIRMYEKGDLPDLDAELIYYYSILLQRSESTNTETKQRYTLLNAFERIIMQKGIDSLVDLLRKFPASEKRVEEIVVEKATSRFPFFRNKPRRAAENEDNYVPRHGAYPWLVTDKQMMYALDEALRSRYKEVKRRFHDNEESCPALIEAVYEITPEPSELYSDGQKITYLLFSYWRDIAPSSSSTKKRMNELRKMGAYDKNGHKNG